jgi:hypothetical protein
MLGSSSLLEGESGRVETGVGNETPEVALIQPANSD